MTNTTHDCIIAVDERGECVLLKCTPRRSYDIEIFDDGFYMDQYVDNPGDIPTEYGVYKCKVEVSYFQSQEDDRHGNIDLTRIIKNVSPVYISSVDLLPKKTYSWASFGLMFQIDGDAQSWICSYYSHYSKQSDSRFPSQKGATIEEAAQKMVLFMQEHYPGMLS